MELGARRRRRRGSLTQQSSRQTQQGRYRTLTFHTLKTELIHHTAYATRDAAKRDPFAYIETDYNRQRLHSALGYRTLQQAELQAV